MNILVVNGNPHEGGFIAGSLDIAAAHLAENGAQVDRLNLREANIADCRGCFTCLRTGRCVLRDDMDDIVARMRRADGFVVGASVRNGYVTALYKRFYERITYPLGFPLHLEEKHTLALSCVGLMGGKKIARNLLGLQDVMHTRLSGFLFRAVGIPAKVEPAALRPELTRAADRLLVDIRAQRPRSFGQRAAYALDRTVMRRFVFARNPELYAAVIESYREKNYL
ncbi:MAG TPA: flavodoxin family protein [bacterium]|nr:flavodoxin family protein [bacterium]